MKTGRGLVLPWLARLVILGALAPGAHHAAEDLFCLREIPLVIPQVDYEGAIYYQPGDPLPRIGLEKVRWDRVVQKEHRAVVMTSQYLEVTVLPQMGRVYSMVFRPTGHEVLWRNDIVRPGGGNNETGWWLWIGGIEYTLPGDEHGTTWALPWTYRVLEDSPARKAVRMQVTEPTTGLVERIDLSLYPEAAGFEADIRIANPGAPSRPLRPTPSEPPSSWRNPRPQPRCCCSSRKAGWKCCAAGPRGAEPRAGRGRLRRGQPLSAPNWMPRTKKRWPKMNSRIIGSIINTEPAISSE